MLVWQLQTHKFDELGEPSQEHVALWQVSVQHTPAMRQLLAPSTEG